MKIYLIRHGQTLFNIKGMAQGWCDAPLTEDGVRQAKACGLALREVPFEACYSSVSMRAVDTANYLLGNREIPFFTDRGLMEMNFGRLEGEALKALRVTRGWDYYQGFKDAGGESTEETMKRTFGAVKKIAQQYDRGNVLVVSHGWAIRSILRSIDQKTADAFYDGAGHSAHCSVTILDYEDGKFTIETMFDPSYVERGMQMMEEEA